MEEYASIISSHNAGIRFETNIERLTWEYCIKNKIYAYPDCRDMHVRTFYQEWNTYVEAIMFANFSVSHTYVMRLINTFHRASPAIVKLLYNRGFRDFVGFRVEFSSESDREVYFRAFITAMIEDVEETEIDTNAAISFYTNFLSESNKDKLYRWIITELARHNIPKKVFIPSDVSLDENAVIELFNSFDKQILKTKYRNIIMYSKDTVFEYVQRFKEILPEFHGILSEITLNITACNKEAITEEMFFENVPPKDIDIHPAILYIHIFREAPPEYMCLKDVRNQIISVCNIYNIYLPSYLYEDIFKKVACEHYDAPKHYINEDTDDIRCEACSRGEVSFIHNITCPICADHKPKEIHVYKCHHTICKQCRTIYDMKECPCCPHNG